MRTRLLYPSPSKCSIKGESNSPFGILGSRKSNACLLKLQPPSTIVPSLSKRSTLNEANSPFGKATHEKDQAKKSQDMPPETRKPRVFILSPSKRLIRGEANSLLGERKAKICLLKHANPVCYCTLTIQTLDQRRIEFAFGSKKSQCMPPETC